ncbi:phospholipase A and acyltransferase 3-like isoform X3 [Sebastes umbrosus]|uniref:phospholipase A and acyltransferase 3-like isoform X3 n=1 Tax=Sebastes umbrosus TaxID=72105 RepID=UPI00189CA2A7|nr:phospholipase A and acyltransferase 3-like isoform X3 [Sebastes umbrosus]
MAPYDEKPKPGDLIEIFRGPYEHWAVYVGDGFIVHLTSRPDVLGASANSLRSVTTKKAMVKKEKLRDVVGNNKWKISNRLDEKYDPRSVQDIVREAYAKVGKELHYDVLMENCEHFANELRYGKAESRQARKAGENALAAGGAAIGVSLVGALGIVAVALAKALNN